MNCQATTKAGRPCLNQAKEGTAYCSSHLGTARPKSKLTPQVHELIVQALRAGNYAKAAIQAAGLGQTTYYRWLETGEADAEYGRDTPERALWESTTRATAEAEVQAVALLRRAMPDDWRAAIAYLERRHPQAWGKRERHEHTGAGGGPITHSADLSKLTEDELVAWRQLQAKARI